MYLNKDSIQNTWCPLAKRRDGDFDTVESQGQPGCCIGDMCAAWREAGTEFYIEYRIDLTGSDNDFHGYCGLAGKPC